MGDMLAVRAEAQLRAGVYARLSETYDAAESVPTQLERGTDHAQRRGWMVAATFKDDGCSGFKEITRDGFADLVEAIEAGRVDVVIVRDIDRLTRNLPDWNAFEKGVLRGMETLRARVGKRGQERAGPGGPGPEGADGSTYWRGERWFGYTRVYANPDEPNRKKRHIAREDINPVEADTIRDVARRLLDEGDTVASVLQDWTARGIKPVAARVWWPTTLVGMLRSPGLAGLLEWQGQKYPTTQWSAILDADTHERLVRLLADPVRRRHVARAPAHLLSGIAVCPSAAAGCITGRHAQRRADSYACVKGPARCGGTAIKVVLLEEYVTGAILNALESPRVQEALRGSGHAAAQRRA